MDVMDCYYMFVWTGIWMNDCIAYLFGQEYVFG